MSQIPTFSLHQGRNRRKAYSPLTGVKPTGSINPMSSITEERQSEYTKTFKSEPNMRNRNWSELDKVGNSNETFGPDQLAFRLIIKIK